MIDENRLLSSKILIVDDQSQNVLLLEKMLKSAKYTTIVSTTDPRLVEEIYLEIRPDLVLLDLRMPYLDGFQVMERLHAVERNSYLPVLVLTAQSDRETRLRALEMGAKDFLGKPFDQTEVLMRIRNMLEIRLLHNQLNEQNTVLDDRVKERTRELHDTRLEVIHRLGCAAEYRDDDTGSHIIRIGRYCEKMARAMDLLDKDCELALHASPMHDIGKIGVPDRIMLKPGRFDEDEWSIMKSHTTIGGKILSCGTSELIDVSKEIALTHHERWDGTGYPSGLAGDNIPLFGRICAIVDVFDALTSKRPYKKAWSVRDAVREIESCRGTLFDPHITDVFMRILPEIVDIRERCKD